MNKQAIKTVKVSATNVQFGNAWFSHESITGYTADQLNAGACGVTSGAYMAWLSADEPACEFDEAKERELFEAAFKKPDTADFVNGEYRYIGEVDKPDFMLFLGFVNSWFGWLACAKSRAGTAS